MRRLIITSVILLSFAVLPASAVQHFAYNVFFGTGTGGNGVLDNTVQMVQFSLTDGDAPPNKSLSDLVSYSATIGPFNFTEALASTPGSNFFTSSLSGGVLGNGSSIMVIPKLGSPTPLSLTSLGLNFNNSTGTFNNATYGFYNLKIEAKPVNVPDHSATLSLTLLAFFMLIAFKRRFTK